MHCYLLESTDKRRTYIGATVDVDRRLDQHNRKLAGGAKATAGRNWRRVLYVSGFPSWPDTLSFEWAWKYYSKQKGVAGRLEGLLHLLGAEKCTSNATPFRLWCQNFSVIVSTSIIPELKKIETWSALSSKLGVEFQSNSILRFKLLSFFPSSKMSSSNVSVAQFQQLQVSIDALKADVQTLNARLAAALSAPAATAAAPEVKKRGRKPKADVAAAPTATEPVATEPTATGDKKQRKKREPKEKATCPTAAEGVVRFAGCADKNEYKVFNNMYRSPFTVDDKEFPSVAHFLAYKKYETTDKEYADKMLAQKNPALLTGMLKSKDHVARADYDTLQNDLLKTALEAKFKNAELRATLLKTDGQRIEFESATDSYFGIGADGNGANTLGKSLAWLRASLA